MGVECDMGVDDGWLAGDLVALGEWGGTVREYVVVKTVAGNGYLLKPRSWLDAYYFVKTFSDGRPVHESWVVLQRPYKPRDYKLIFSIIAFVVTVVTMFVLLMSMKQ